MQRRQPDAKSETNDAPRSPGQSSSESLDRRDDADLQKTHREGSPRLHPEAYVAIEHSVVPVGHLVYAVGDIHGRADLPARVTSVVGFIIAVIAALGAGCPYATPARAEDTLRGKADIVDGDTIKIAGIPIRLEGIDAPEQRQSCAADENRAIPCGELATKMLAQMIDGAPVTCVLRGKDSYGRLLGDCSTESGSLNARMVRSGWALAFVKYSQLYVGEEQEARTARAGLWQWQFDKPWDWRAGILQEAVGSPESPDGCVIKGNISASGERGSGWPDRIRKTYGRSLRFQHSGLWMMHSGMR